METPKEDFLFFVLFTFNFFFNFFLCLLTRRVETMDYVHFFQIKLDGEWSAVSSQTRMGSKGSDSVLTTFRECSRSLCFRLITSHGFEKIFVVRRSLHVPNTIRAYSSLC